ncbi:MAG: ABC transporter ATP-binding protein [Anaerolineae bacterium]
MTQQANTAPPTPASGSDALKRLMPYFAPFKSRLFLITALLIIGTLVDLAAPYLLGVAVDQLVGSAERVLPAWLVLLLGRDPGRAEALRIVMLTLATAYVLTWALSVTQFRLMVRMSQSILLTMRAQVLDKLHGLSIDFFDEHQAGDLMSRLTSDTQVINDMFGQGLMRLLRMALGLIGIVIAMISLNWRLALAAFGILPVILLVTAHFSRRVRTAYRATRQTIGAVSAELQENISGVREVQAFAREQETIDEFRAVNQRNRDAHVKAGTLSAVFSPVLDVLSTIATAFVIGVGGYMALRFNPPLVTVGVIVTFLNYVRRFYDPIREIASLYGELQSAIAGSERIFQLLDTPSRITDRPGAVSVPAAVTGHIRYENVSFRYEEDEPVLESIDVEILPGQTIALVGATGAGKSTFVNLLLRFYDVQSGRITVDGHDLRDLSSASLREAIGMVQQDTYLFSTTIMENIRYGRLDATDEQVKDAAKTANADDFIQRLPDGYQSQVGERGSLLSQGHRQMLSIARAILRSPRVLVLDEATSSVDTRTELLIQQALDNLMADRTSVVIAHRLSTIRKADQILLIQYGHIIERGTHDELLDKGEAYYSLYMSQFRGQEDSAAAIIPEGVCPPDLQPDAN